MVFVLQNNKFIENKLSGEYYNKQYMDGRTEFCPQQMIYLNHYYWDLIASISAIHGIEYYMTFVSINIGIKNISSIEYLSGYFP